MSFWQENNIEEKVTQILADVPEYDPEHHLGYPYLSAYQLAIEFKQRHPEVVAQLGLSCWRARHGPMH